MRSITKSIFSALAALIYATTSYGSPKVNGTVKAPDGSSIPYCNVVFTSPSDSLLFFGTPTNEDGTFSIDLPAGEYDMCITMIGFETIARRVKLSSEHSVGDIILKESSIQLSEAEVVASRINRKAGSFIFNARGSNLARGQSSLELLNYAPGVWYSKRNGLSVNGNSDVRVVVNNRYLQMSGDDLTQYLESIPSESIRSVEVFPLTGASEDASITGALIKITLNKDSLQGLMGSVSVNYEHNKSGMKQVRPTFNLDYRINKFSLYANGGYKREKYIQVNDENTTYTSEKMNIFSEMTFSNENKYYFGRMGFVYDISEAQSIGLDLDYTGIDGESEASSHSRSGYGDKIVTGTSLYESDDKRDDYNASLNYKLTTDKKGSNLSVITDFFHKENYSIIQGNLCDEGSLPYLSCDINDTYYDNYSARADYKQIFSDKFNISLGGKATSSAMKTDLSATIFNYQDELWENNAEKTDNYTYKELILAGYLNTSISLGNLSMNLGVRVESTELKPDSQTFPDKVKDQNYIDYFPSAQLYMPLNQKKGHSVSASYKNSIQRPGFSHLNPFEMRINSNTRIMGNPDLRPTYVEETQLRLTLFNNFGIYGSYRRDKGKIEEIVISDVTDPNVLIYKKMNMDRNENYNAGVSFTFMLAKWCRIDGNANWNNIENRVLQTVRRINNYNGNISGTVTFSESATMGIWFYAMSKNIFGNMESNPYHSLGIWVNKSFMKSRFNVNICANNLSALYMKDKFFHIEIQGDGFKKTLDQNNGSMSFNAGITLKYSFSAGKQVNVKKAEAGNSDERRR